MVNTWGKAVSSLKISPAVSPLLCSWAQSGSIGEPLWSSRKLCFWWSVSVRYNLVENFLRVEPGQWQHILNYHVTFEALKFHRCFFVHWQKLPRCSPGCLERMRQCICNRAAASISLIWAPVQNSYVGKLFGRCYNQSWRPTVLCIMCQMAWRDEDLPQGTQVAQHLLCRIWSGMLGPGGCCHFVIISMLAGFAGQTIRPAGGFSLAVVLRKGFLL